MTTWQEQQAGSDPASGPTGASRANQHPRLDEVQVSSLGTPEGPPGMRRENLPFPDAGPNEEAKQLRNEAQILRWEKQVVQAVLAAVEANPKDPRSVQMDAIQARNTALDGLITQKDGSARAAESADRTEQKEATAKPKAGTELGFTLEQITTDQGKRNVRVYWKADGNGGKLIDQSKGDKGVEDAGSAESALDVATAQANLQRLQQAIANENDPLKKEQLRLQVDQARFNLEQARAKSPLDLQTAQLNYDKALLDYQNASDETARETRRVALQQAQVALQKAQQDLNRPATSTSEGIVTGVDPLTGKIVYQTDTRTEAQREVAARGTLPQNAYAAYQQEVQRLQGRAQQELDRLKGLQEQGALSSEQAERQFQQWFGQYVSTPLAGLRAAAEEAQRAEKAQIDERNRLEDVRVAEANRRREETATQYGEAERARLVATFPNARSREFAEQFGANVAAMSQRAKGATAEERMRATRGPGYTGAAFDPQHIVNVMPSPDQIAAAARDRALAAIAPAQAVRAGYTAPALPAAPDIAALIGSVPYTGPLSAAPTPASGLLPTPGREAVDLGPSGQPGMARTYFGPDGRVYQDWGIPG